MFVFVAWFALWSVCTSLLACSMVCLYLSFGLLYDVFVFVSWFCSMVCLYFIFGLLKGVFVFVFWFALRCVCICLVVCSMVCLYFLLDCSMVCLCLSFGLLLGVFVF